MSVTLAVRGVVPFPARMAKFVAKKTLRGHMDCKVCVFGRYVQRMRETILRNPKTKA